MHEVPYRASRVCRTLGSPVVFAIVTALLERGSLTPGELARSLRRSIQTISTHLAKLRTADLVRYDTAGGRTRYRLKHPRETRRLLAALGGVVAATTQVPDQSAGRPRPRAKERGFAPRRSLATRRGTG